MKTFLQHKLTIVVWLGLAATAFPQVPGTDHVTIPLSDPSRPGTVKVNLLAGSISVKGYAGKEIIVDAKARQEEESHGHRRADTSGMKRIPNTSTGLTVEEEGNVVSISTGSLNRSVDISLQVPARSTLRLKTINDGDIKVEQVQGEIEVNDINGSVNLTQVSGSVVAHALNGNVKVSMVSIEPNKPMSFSSLNGDIDVSFPPDLKANASMKTDNGEIFSDFDIKIEATAVQPVAGDARGKGGKFRIKIDKTTKGTINGGGPEFQFKTFNGNIYIRKSAK
jgi:DUF4097 and DUF4098 domain-containing protein YvlB